MILSLSILTATFPDGPGLAHTRMFLLWVLLELRMMMCGSKWSYKMCKVPVISHSPPVQQHPAFYRLGCPSNHPSNTDKALKGNQRP